MNENEKEDIIPAVPGLELRYTIFEDAEHLKEWLLEPGILRGFPMQDPPEIDDSVKHWIGFSKYKSSLTATLDGKPVGIATLCLMPYRIFCNGGHLSRSLRGQPRHFALPPFRFP
jgi:hypothetical protein